MVLQESSSENRRSQRVSEGTDEGTGEKEFVMVWKKRGDCPCSLVF